MGRSLIAAWLFASLFLSCERGNTDVTLLDPQTHGSYAGSAFWSGNNFPQWVNGDILEDTAGDAGGNTKEDTNQPGEDTEEPTCTESQAICTCAEGLAGWAPAIDFCKCEDANPGNTNFNCECCWKAFDETAPDFETWKLMAGTCSSNQMFADWLPEAGCQD